MSVILLLLPRKLFLKSNALFNTITICFFKKVTLLTDQMVSNYETSKYGKELAGIFALDNCTFESGFK